MEFPTDEGLWLTGFDQMHVNTAVEHLGIKLESISADQIVLTMPITDKARQPFGLLHGGITMALVETAASVHASWGVDLSDKSPVGIEINGSHVRPAREGTVRAVGKVVRRSRSMIVHQVDVFLVETGELLSTARMTNYYKPMIKESDE
jgi:uncharacterized protein (TIGR00369 family)